MSLMRFKIQSKIKAVHYDIVNDLMKEYDDIMIPKFQVSNMVKKESRKINKENTRKMLNWSHFQFRQRLINKAEEVRSIVYEVTEQYTR